MARDLIEANDIGWTYWEFGSFFGVYDPIKGIWIEPIRRALLD
jgi:endoglucanase